MAIQQISLQSILESGNRELFNVPTHAAGPQGVLPFSPEMLLTAPSGNLFGLTQSAGMGWEPGRLLDPDDFATREAAREDLLDCVRKAGVLVGENVWVWDETGRAQLVLATLPTPERARKVAERLRGKGLNITVRREMPPKE